MTEKLLLEGFVKGRSEAGCLGNFLHRMNMKDLGREIRIKKGKLKTREIFEDIDVLFPQEGMVLVQSGVPSKYHYRRSFPHETLEGLKSQWKFHQIMMFF